MRHSLPDPHAPRDGILDEAEMQRRIDEAVRQATEPLRARIEQLTQNRDSILREKKELQGRAIEAANEREEQGPKAIDFAITRSQSRDPQTYRRAKQRANDAGFELVILNDALHGREGAPADVFQTDTHYHVFGPPIKGDHAAYQRHRLEAQRLGLRFHLAETAAEMPSAAFGTGGE